jgi:uncharacterized membrane protein
MNGALWVVQALVGLAFLVAGFMHATRPVAALVPQAPWTGAIPLALLRFIGVAELLGGIGVILPLLTGTLPGLAPLAAAAIALLMLLAAIFHATRREYPAIAANVVLGTLAAFVAYGRTALTSV